MAGAKEIRCASLPRLPAIRTLRFFQGAIDEVLQIGLDPGYIHYLAAKIKPLVAEKDAAYAPAATNRQIPAFPDCR